MNLPPVSSNAAGSRRRSGFTLTEALIVIALSAAITFFTLPIALRFYQNQVVVDTAQSLKALLRRARSNAAAQRNDSRFGVRVQTAEFVLFQGDSYASRTASEDLVVDYPSSLSVTGTSNEFVFSKLFATSSVSGTIVIVGDGPSASVSINAAGKIEE